MLCTYNRIGVIIHSQNDEAVKNIANALKEIPYTRGNVYFSTYLDTSIAYIFVRDTGEYHRELSTLIPRECVKILDKYTSSFLRMYRHNQSLYYKLVIPYIVINDLTSIINHVTGISSEKNNIKIFFEKVENVF